MTFSKLLLIFSLFFIAACKETVAEDADVGLYDPVAPPGSAFVRFVNLSEEGFTPNVNGKKFNGVEKGDVSPYIVVKKGTANFKLGGQNTEQAIDEEKFYTAILTDELVILDDTPNSNRAKATVAFYNLSDEALTLKAKGGSVPVLKNVAPQTQGARDMNAVKVDFSVHDEAGEKKNVLDPQIIERGNHYSVIYNDDDILFINAETDTTQ